jgi:hypothetical protein
VRALLTAGLFVWLGSVIPAPGVAAEPVVRLRALPPSNAPPAREAVVSGSLDDQLQPFSKSPGHTYWKDYWLKVMPLNPTAVSGIPVVIVNTTRGLQVEMAAYRNGTTVALQRAAQLAGFLGTRDDVFILPEGVPSLQPLSRPAAARNNF